MTTISEPITLVQSESPEVHGPCHGISIQLFIRKTNTRHFLSVSGDQESTIMESEWSQCSRPLRFFCPIPLVSGGQFPFTPGRSDPLLCVHQTFPVYFRDLTRSPSTNWRTDVYILSKSRSRPDQSWPKGFASWHERNGNFFSRLNPR